MTVALAVRTLGAGSFLLALAVAGNLSGCAAGPDYVRPASGMPASWSSDSTWKVARPEDAAVRDGWWKVFGEARLDALEDEAIARNPGLAQVVERLAQARAQATIAASTLFPGVTAGVGAARDKISANRPVAIYGFRNSSVVQNDFTAGFSVHYELDLFGAQRRQLEAARAGVGQADALLANARLVLTAELAADYFTLRALDTEIDVVERNIAAQRKALEFVTSRHDMGVASGLDLAQQKSQLDTTITQVDLLRVQRDQFEHAIASLVGEPAPSFRLAPAPGLAAPPAIPAGVPSDLLQRRPDIAAAERAMAAANAQIGVAKAAWFPSVSLAAAGGDESNVLATLFKTGSGVWSLGASASEILFDAGRRGATVDIARSGYRAAVDDYRATVLRAMQEVEDGMTGLASLERAAAEADASVASAQRVVDLANDRYNGGLANYLDVITAQQALLANQRLSAQINGQRMLSAVYLVKALGGGWDASGS